MRRFVIEGFSVVSCDGSLCGSAGGAAFPLRLSVLGTAIPFCIVGRDSGDPMTDDVADVEGDGRGLSGRSSRCAATVVMMFARILEVSSRSKGGVVLIECEPPGGAGNARALVKSRKQNRS